MLTNSYEDGLKGVHLKNKRQQDQAMQVQTLFLQINNETHKNTIIYLILLQSKFFLQLA